MGTLSLVKAISMNGVAACQAKFNPSADYAILFHRLR
jgi:hypothetical protein